jgi:hypothetical protein
LTTFPGTTTEGEKIAAQFHFRFYLLDVIAAVGRACVGHAKKMCEEGVWLAIDYYEPFGKLFSTVVTQQLVTVYAAAIG